MQLSDQDTVLTCQALDALSGSMRREANALSASSVSTLVDQSKALFKVAARMEELSRDLRSGSVKLV